MVSQLENKLQNYENEFLEWKKELQRWNLNMKLPFIFDITCLYLFVYLHYIHPTYYFDVIEQSVE